MAPITPKINRPATYKQRNRGCWRSCAGTCSSWASTRSTTSRSTRSAFKLVLCVYIYIHNLHKLRSPLPFLPSIHPSTTTTPLHTLLQVNKPFLPLAARRMSGQVAWALVVGACAMGLGITKRFFRCEFFVVGCARRHVIIGVLHETRRPAHARTNTSTPIHPPTPHTAPSSSACTQGASWPGRSTPSHPSTSR